MKEEEIDYSDIPALGDDFFKNARVRWPGNKKQLTLRLDPDVVDYFKHLGKGYQSTMNYVLRRYMEAHCGAPADLHRFPTKTCSKAAGN